ncbi:uncharacterized protein LOC119281935 [Triticum dicoccoides]|uniref:uncharacterized protein LOC119281935 n=1 Tax=Triticum dicoccoides TaxID=85692 RepID=UPI00188F4173|nr:uncharacterized protein LOC119281935 [Triticum dicoccoides]
MKATHTTLLLAVAFLVLASEAAVKADDICAGSVHKTPIPCDLPGCLHICRENANGLGPCPTCNWTANCNTYTGLCECNICMPPPSAPSQQ